MRVTAANFHGETYEYLTLNRIVEQIGAFELVDMHELKVKATPTIMAQIQEAVENEEYDKIEWEKFTPD